MRICMYTSTALPLMGGQEVVVDALARQYLAAGHEVVVLAPRPGRRLRLGDAKLPYRVVRHPRFLSMRRFVEWYCWWLVRLHRRHSFDVIHSHGIYPPAYLAALCRDRLPCPQVITSHGDDVGSARRLQEPELCRRHTLALRRADALVAISPFTHEGYLGLCPEVAGRVINISNGVDVDTLAIPARRPAGLTTDLRPGGYFLFLGRLVPRKGVDVLMRALARLPAMGPVDLVVAGDGPERPALERLAAELELSERVRFVGMVRGLAKTYLLQNSRCLVLPTVEWEGQGLVVLESFAAGRPVIASDLPGVAELVKPDRTGWLVPQRSVEALTEALARVAADGPERAAFGTAAQHAVQDYSWSAVAAQHLELFQRLRNESRLAAGIRRDQEYDTPSGTGVAYSEASPSQPESA